MSRGYSPVDDQSLLTLRLTGVGKILEMGIPSVYIPTPLLGRPPDPTDVVLRNVVCRNVTDV